MTQELQPLQTASRPRWRRLATAALAMLAPLGLLALIPAASGPNEPPPTSPPQRESITIGSGKLTYLWRQTALTGGKTAPLLVLLHGDHASPQQTAETLWRQWEPVAAARNWHLAVVETALPLWSDGAARALATLSETLTKSQPVDPLRRYLMGFGDTTSQVFLSVSRTPDHWTAACAVLGTAQPAIESNRLFGANTVNTPVLWVWPDESRETFNPLLAKLRAAKFQVQTRLASQVTVESTLQWLEQQSRDEFPAIVDYETGSKAFTRAFWLEMTQFDPGQRNDALPVSRVNPGSGAYLDLGGFGYDPRDLGPGITVTWLPQGYSGPLQIKDRILSVGGRAVEGGKGYQTMMEEVRKDQQVSVMIERAGKRQRLETRIVLPQREELVTVRIRGEYQPQLNEVLVISRGVTEFQIHLPEIWAPIKVSWNGQVALDADIGGCWKVGPISNPQPSPCKEP